MLLSESRSSDWQLKTSLPCRDGHVAVQFNPRVTTPRTKRWSIICLAAFLQHARPDPTPQHNGDTHTHTAASAHPHLSTGSESTHEPKSTAVTKTPYQVAPRRPGQRLQVYCSLLRLLWQHFILLFHFIPPWYVSQLSVCPPPPHTHSLCSLNSILAASASKLSSQSSQNDYNLDLCFISFPLRKPTLLPHLEGPFSQLPSTGSRDVAPAQRPRWPVSSCWVRVKKAWTLVSKAWDVLEAWISAESETVTSTGQRKPSRLLHTVAQ